MVAGDAVNTAARVQSRRRAGRRLVGEATQRARAAIEYDDAGEHALKGKEGEPPLWRPTGSSRVGGGSQRVDGLEAPLTGRDAELRRSRSCSTRRRGAPPAARAR